MTLDEMFIECVRQANVTIAKTGSAYLGTSLTAVNKFKSGINYAYLKICREKWMPRYHEDVTLDADLQFDVEDLGKTFNGIINILDSDENDIDYIEKDDSIIRCPKESAGDIVTPYYFYLPNELADLTDVPVFPVRAVDHKILCYMGTYYYFSIDEDTKADIWLNLFNDGFANIRQAVGGVAYTPRGKW
jgi:hypothetical protein